MPPPRTLWDGDLTSVVDTSKVGSYNITYEVSDGEGNISSVTRSVTVVDTTAPVLTLQGEATITHEGGTDYSDAGATVSDSVDSDIEVLTGGTVDTSKLGEYSLTFDATDASGNKAIQLSRKVTVVDTTPPLLTLRGSADTTVVKDGSFTDPGATAMDAVEGISLHRSLLVAKPSIFLRSAPTLSHMTYLTVRAISLHS